MDPSAQSTAPGLPGGIREEAFQIAAATRGGIGKHSRIRTRAIRDDVEYAAESRVTIQRRGSALDQLDPLAVQGRSLQQSEVIRPDTQRGATVRQDECVSGGHPAQLQPSTAESRCRRLVTGA